MHSPVKISSDPLKSGSEAVVVMQTTEGPVWMDGLTHKAPALQKH